MRFYKVFFLLLFVLSVSMISCEKSSNSKPTYKTWSRYLGGPDRNHYSTLSEINRENVAELKLAWSYKSPDYGQMQMNPIVVDTILYGVTAALRAIALNASTGEEIWRFGDSLQVFHSTSRGVSYWQKENDKRILYTRGSSLYALNALTGDPISSFGDNGKIDLRSGLPKSAQDKFVISNTPGTIFEDLIIMPIRASEDIGAAPGDLMAFNVVSGEVEWVFHTIPDVGEKGIESWEIKNPRKNEIIGAANNWAGMAIDEKAGIVYVPTGSVAPDFYGGIRNGDNLFSNCLLALDASTGERIWHFQFTHHDIWDRDLPAPPNLILVERKGKKIPAVAQVTKQGYVYVFDRKTGEPLFDIVEKPVPASKLKGEIASKTQPFPVSPKPFARQSSDISNDDFNPYAENIEEIKGVLKSSDKRIYAPPNVDPVFILPGYDGAAEWGGAAADPNEGIIYVNSNEMPWIVQMKDMGEIEVSETLGEQVYSNKCAVCHKQDRSGLEVSGFPSLQNIKSRITKEEASQIITQGRGMMTGFPLIPTKEKEALLAFLFDEGDKQEVVSEEKNYPLPYRHMGYNKFLDADGNAAISPPWGTMHAIDLNTGKYIWSIPFGETPSLLEKGIKGTGCENYGGPVITENGLLFIGATKDGYFRVFDKYTGEPLWEYKLPAAAFATPAMYEVDGKQFIAIACGGGKLGTEKGNQIIAFSLE